MTTFYLACAGLVLLSGIFYLFPRVPRNDGAQDLEQANLDWLRRRQRELDVEADPELADDARLRLLEDTQQGSQSAQHDAARFPSWVLLPVVAVMSALLYYRLGGAQDVLIAEQLRGIGQQTTPAQMEALVSSISARAEQRPDNLHYLALLGRYHMGQENYREALDIYRAILEEVPEDAATLAYAAQAEYLAGGRTLTDAARLNAERALAANPHERTALGLLGMASYEQGQYRAAIEYWERLLVMEPPDSDSAAMITDVIGRARAQLGEEPPAVAEPAVAIAGPGVTVRVSLPQGAAVRGDEAVFVLARDPASGSRMPLAVQRFTAAQLPLTVRLDDDSSMAGQKLSAVDTVEVVVQLSPGGQPGDANATWLGRVGPVEPSTGTAVLPLELVPNGGPSPAAEPATTAGVTVRVSLPADAQVAPSDTLFVLARDPASGSRMPIAVQRLTAGELPVTLRLDDRSSMAGQKISQAASVLVVAQLSPDGRPGDANATWVGSAGPVIPGRDARPLALELVPNSAR